MVAARSLRTASAAQPKPLLTCPLSVTSLMSTPRASALNNDGLTVAPLTWIWPVASEGMICGPFLKVTSSTSSPSALKNPRSRATKIPASDRAPTAPSFSVTRGLRGSRTDPCADDPCAHPVATTSGIATSIPANDMMAARKRSSCALGVLLPCYGAVLAIRHFVLVIRPQEVEQARTISALRAVSGLVGGERDRSAHDLG